MYAKFSKFYDHIPLSDFTPIILEYMKARQIVVQRVLDLGCGTGTFLLRLAEQGIAGTGLDLSEEMIALARQKAEQSPRKELLDFQVAGMSEFSLNRTYDLVTSNLDSLNHLLSEEEVRKTFSQAYRHLNERGIFYFDIHTITGLRSWSYQHNLHDRDLVRFWHGTFNEETFIGTLHIDAFLRVDPRTPYYARHQETVLEKAYPLADVLDWLKAAQFKKVEPIGPVAGLSVEEMEKHIRCFFCAHK